MLNISNRIYISYNKYIKYFLFIISYYNKYILIIKIYSLLTEKG